MINHNIVFSMGALYFVLYNIFNLTITDKIYGEELKEKTGKTIHKFRIKYYSIGLLLFSLLAFFFKEHILPLTLIFILLTQTVEASILDRKIHVIPRQIQRLAYIFTTGLVIYNNPDQWKNIILVQFVLVILLLFMNDPGPADFRALMTVYPVLSNIWENKTIIVIVVNIFAVMVFQYAVQKYHGDRKMNVPIGDKLLLVGTILSSLGLIF